MLTFDDFSLVLNYLCDHPECINSVTDHSIEATINGSRLQARIECMGSCLIVTYINECEHDITLSKEEIEYFFKYIEDISDKSLRYSKSQLFKAIHNHI